MKESCSSWKLYSVYLNIFVRKKQQEVPFYWGLTEEKTYEIDHLTHGRDEIMVHPGPD